MQTFCNINQILMRKRFYIIILEKLHNWGFHSGLFPFRFLTLRWPNTINNVFAWIKKILMISIDLTQTRLHQLDGYSFVLCYWGQLWHLDGFYWNFMVIVSTQYNWIKLCSSCSRTQNCEVGLMSVTSWERSSFQLVKTSGKKFLFLALTE